MDKNEKDEFIEEEIIETVGGIVGRFLDFYEHPLEIKQHIGVQFKYIDDNGEKVKTPCYALTPKHARYLGWHLLRRGIVDSLKKRK